MSSLAMPEYAGYLVPNVVVQTPNGERGYDIYSRLLKDRIIMLTGQINDDLASIVCSQLLFLDSEDKKKDIYLYINSPGGSVTAGMAIYDTMNFIKPDVSTVCMGMAASMGAFLLSSGAEGKRMCLPNAEVMIHQVLGGAQGQATDVEITARHLMKTKEKMTRIMAKNTGKSYDEVYEACERDNWLTAEEALDFGLIDKIAK